MRKLYYIEYFNGDGWKWKCITGEREVAQRELHINFRLHPDVAWRISHR